jgi:catechol 2,3-dioxygenase-like lactoylglutathione lyase family enzyme
MIKVNEAAFFGYPVTDMARARKFYEGILGLKPSGEPTTVPWIEYDLGNATLGLGAYPGWNASRDGAMVALEVDDFEKAVVELRQKAIPFHYEPTETPVCHFAIVRDPDDNAVMIHKRKPGHA